MVFHLRVKARIPELAYKALCSLLLLFPFLILPQSHWPPGVSQTRQVPFSRPLHNAWSTLLSGICVTNSLTSFKHLRVYSDYPIEKYDRLPSFVFLYNACLLVILYIIDLVLCIFSSWKVIYTRTDILSVLFINVAVSLRTATDIW